MSKELHTEIKTGFGAPCASSGYRSEEHGFASAVMGDVDQWAAAGIFEQKTREWDRDFFRDVGRLIGKRLVEVKVAGIEAAPDDDTLGTIDKIVKQDDPWSYMEEMGIPEDAVDAIADVASVMLIEAIKAKQRAK